MQGLEFMVSHDPSENGHKIENSGVWVIRKQTRKKRQGAEDEISCISSYFVVGENIYMAPSVMSIISNRMVCALVSHPVDGGLTNGQLSVVTSANQMLSTMSTLPIFTPSLGHTYLPPAPKSINSATSTQVNQTSGGNTPIPGTQETLPSSKTLPASQAALPSDDQGFQMLAESYSLSLRYGSEYMDENALVGEPGSFIMSKTREPAPPTSLKIQTSIPMKSAESAETKTPTPFASGKKANRGTERSPISPSTKDKKVRRKSKAIGTVTPK